MLALQESSEVAVDVVSVALVGVKVHMSPGGIEVETLSATVPVKPFTPVSVMVALAEDPAFAVSKV